MRIPGISTYFDWLQKDNPTGDVERYPEIDSQGETSLKGVFVVGDLTGIPLLKLASESGSEIVKRFCDDEVFAKQRKAKGSGELDVVIVGAGPSGMAAALECRNQKLSYVVLEASQRFNTIVNFPKGKPIFANPFGRAQNSPLVIEDGTKESLLEALYRQTSDRDLNVACGSLVKKIDRDGILLRVQTGNTDYKSLRVVLAMGKSGNARMLKVPGEQLPKVYNRLFDPEDFKDQEILVVGGGDSALEASIALAEAGNRVFHSYRRPAFSRPKEENQTRFDRLVEKGSIEPLMPSEVRSISDRSVVIETGDGVRELSNDAVFTLIGRELPLSFFKRSGIRMQGEKDRRWYVFLVAMLSFFTMLYFGKAGVNFDVFGHGASFSDKLLGYFTAPFTQTLKWVLPNYVWYGSLNFVLGWLGSLVFLVSGVWALAIIVSDRERYFGSPWGKIKYGYFIFVGVFYTWIYFTNSLGTNAGWLEAPTYWYSLLYCTTMALFGIRRAIVKPTPYIRYQMAVLIFIQIFFLFLLPFHLYEPFLTKWFSSESYLIREMFPNGKWSSFGYILFWPLNINNFGTSTFWTWFPFVQTFGILLFLVQRWGKGAYCGWICSCGGMAESLGDEYRQLAPHGPGPKRMENIGQWVLLFAFVATGFHYGMQQGWLGSGEVSDTLWGSYKLSIDVFFAGVLGLGMYFVMGGRVWCRFGCPLAALMHIYTRFSVYRIFAEKKKCISCNICTKVCHMGIDVMNYANKGVPLNDVECVRCSACVQSCPMDVLAFGSVGNIDTENRDRTAVPAFGKKDWRAGLR